MRPLPTMRSTSYAISKCTLDCSTVHRLGSLVSRLVANQDSAHLGIGPCARERHDMACKWVQRRRERSGYRTVLFTWRDG